MNSTHYQTNAKPIGIIVLMPTRGTPSRETELCLRHHLEDYPHRIITVSGKPVVEARNQLAKEARDLDLGELEFEPRYVLGTDDDAWWPRGHVDRAVTILEDNPEVAMVTGVFCCRGPYLENVAAKAVRFLCVEVYDIFKSMRHEPGELVEIDLCGGHWFVIRRDVLISLGDEPFSRLPNRVAFPNSSTVSGLAPEDYSFCRRLRWAGHKIVIERTLRVGHVDVTNGLCYYPNLPPFRANGLGTPRYDPELAKVKTPPSGELRRYHDIPGLLEAA
jgi:hypothetical protein